MRGAKRRHLLTVDKDLFILSKRVPLRRDKLRERIEGRIKRP